MRLSFGALPVLLAQGVSLAHVPGSEQTVVESMHHQLFGLHHLPMTALLLIVAVALFRIGFKKIVGEAAKKR